MGIRIELSNPNRSYFAGQFLEGWVAIPNTNPEQVKDVTIWVTGMGLANRNMLTEDHNRRLPGIIVSHTDKETYISFKSYLNEPSWISTPERTLIYPFRLPLPQNIPSSFYSPNLQTAYHLTVEVRLHIQKWIDRARLPFTVNGIVDLNQVPGIRLPQTCKKPSGFNVFGHRRGFKLSLPNRSGFVPGEVVNFLVDIRNKGGKEVVGATVSLLQVITLNPHEFIPMTVKQIVKAVKGPVVGEGGRVNWNGTMDIPSIPPSGLGGKCKIANVQYFMRFEMSQSDSTKKLMSGEVPILIGTIPLMSTFQDFYSGASASTNATRIPAVSTPSRVGHDRCTSIAQELQMSHTIPPIIYYQIIPIFLLHLMLKR